ncbi:MAG: ethanolamine utilization protein EutJ [Nitriliruptoraceae bacterium]
MAGSRPVPVQPDQDAPWLLEAAQAALVDRDVLSAEGSCHVGVDLGTAFVVVAVTDGAGIPLAIASQRAEVVRDGVVVDFAGAVTVVRSLLDEVESRLGIVVRQAATTYPPGVAVSEVQACRYVLESAGIECSALVDEPTAANAVLRLGDGAVVDIGGGTTGVAVLRDGEVVHVTDAATGGTHVNLVIAGALGIDVDAAEARKTDPAAQRDLLPLITPVFEKIGTIVAAALREHPVERVHLVGGTAAFPGIAEVVADRIGVAVEVATNPLLVTPLGVALHDPVAADGPVTAAREVEHV